MDVVSSLGKGLNPQFEDSDPFNFALLFFSSLL